MSESQTVIEGWAILDLFGHQQCAGYVSTAIVGTSGMLRVEVPAVDDLPPYTRFYGPGAIYSLTMVTEELARAAVRQLRPQAVTVHIPRQLPPGQEEHVDVREYLREEEDEEDELF